jgi:hypothetical protein
MPIRFRCQHCTQLLGIARRKAGSQVRCPTCQREILVPASSPGLGAGADDSVLDTGTQGGEAPAGVPPAGAAPSLFERDDFEALLRGAAGASGDAGQGRPASVRTPVPPGRPGAVPPPVPRMSDPVPQPAINVEPWPPASAPAPAAGLVLSPTRATVLTVVVILLLAVAFAAGLLVGRLYA